MSPLGKLHASLVLMKVLPGVALLTDVLPLPFCLETLLLEGLFGDESEVLIEDHEVRRQ